MTKNEFPNNRDLRSKLISCHLMDYHRRGVQGIQPNGDIYIQGSKSDYRGIGINSLVLLWLVRDPGESVRAIVLAASTSRIGGASAVVSWGACDC